MQHQPKKKKKNKENKIDKRFLRQIVAAFSGCRFCCYPSTLREREASHSEYKTSANMQCPLFANGRKKSRNDAPSHTHTRQEKKKERMCGDNNLLFIYFMLKEVEMTMEKEKEGMKEKQNKSRLLVKGPKNSRQKLLLLSICLHFKTKRKCAHIEALHRN